MAIEVVAWLSCASEGRKAWWIFIELLEVRCLFS